MSITFGKGNQFKNINMSVYTTVYSIKGDSLTRDLKNTGLSSSSYVRRHYVISGEFGCSFPDSDLPDESGGVGTVWPFDEFKNVDSFTISALKDGSSYHCMTPIGKYHIEHKEYNLKANQTLAAEKGNIYISTVDFMVDNEVHPAGAVLACENNNCTLTMSSAGKVTSFLAVSDL